MRALIIIAHPDDETLYFSAGLKKFSETVELDLLCMTYNEGSPRAVELHEACKNLKIKIHFGGLQDTGIKSCLEGVEEKLAEYVKSLSPTEPYEVIITHPFHGGEKPHPHHIQLFYATRDLCHKENVKFGFFSEKSLRIPRHNKLDFVFTDNFEFKIFIFRIRNIFKNWVSFRFFATQLLMAFVSWRNRKREQKFLLSSFTASHDEKSERLSKYTSQKDFLLHYKTSRQIEEFLYLEK